MLTGKDIENIENECSTTYDFNGGELVRELLKEWKAQRTALEQLGIELVEDE